MVCRLMGRVWKACDDDENQPEGNSFMDTADIVLKRLYNQQLSQQAFKNPVEVVGWMGAVQSQDYGAAKWAVGLRLQQTGDAAIEQAFNDGLILRTHIMRPTWHFVLPVDLRWMMTLTAPRVKAFLVSATRTLELDAETFSRSNAVLAKALQGGNYLTRSELATILEQAGIATNDLRLTHLMMRAELDMVICSGPRRGKQFTYALFDERAPQAPMMEREAALGELVRRYFTSHGPAALQDFVWWSGLTVSDTKAGLDMVKSQLVQEVVNGQTYWYANAPVKTVSADVYLLPNYDEYIVGYTDRSAVYDEEHAKYLDARGNILFTNIMVMDGRVVGTWKRTFRKGAVVVALNPFAPLSAVGDEAFAAAAHRYGEFLGMSVAVTSGEA
jgi:winged helix DNA-binding protein